MASEQEQETDGKQNCLDHRTDFCESNHCALPECWIDSKGYRQTVWVYFWSLWDDRDVFRLCEERQLVARRVIRKTKQIHWPPPMPPLPQQKMRNWMKSCYLLLDWTYETLTPVLTRNWEKTKVLWAE